MSPEKGFLFIQDR